MEVASLDNKLDRNCICMNINISEISPNRLNHEKIKLQLEPWKLMLPESYPDQDDKCITKISSNSLFRQHFVLRRYRLTLHFLIETESSLVDLFCLHVKHFWSNAQVFIGVLFGFAVYKEADRASLYWAISPTLLALLPWHHMARLRVKQKHPEQNQPTSHRVVLVLCYVTRGWPHPQNWRHTHALINLLQPDSERKARCCKNILYRPTEETNWRDSLHRRQSSVGHGSWKPYTQEA